LAGLLVSHHWFGFGFGYCQVTGSPSLSARSGRPVAGSARARHRHTAARLAGLVWLVWSARVACLPGLSLALPGLLGWLAVISSLARSFNAYVSSVVTVLSIVIRHYCLLLSITGYCLFCHCRLFVCLLSVTVGRLPGWVAFATGCWLGLLSVIISLPVAGYCCLPLRRLPVVMPRLSLSVWLVNCLRLVAARLPSLSSVIVIRQFAVIGCWLPSLLIIIRLVCRSVSSVFGLVVSFVGHCSLSFAGCRLSGWLVSLLGFRLLVILLLY
jgi:hypothetical protein